MGFPATATDSVRFFIGWPRHRPPPAMWFSARAVTSLAARPAPISTSAGLPGGHTEQDAGVLQLSILNSLGRVLQ